MIDEERGRAADRGRRDGPENVLKSIFMRAAAPPERNVVKLNGRLYPRHPRP